MGNKISVPEIKETSDRLREQLKDVKEVYVIFRRVSANGMTRWLELAICTDSGIRMIGYTTSIVLGWSYSSKYEGIKVEGAGMDMGFHLVSSLSRRLFGDDYRLSHRWL